MRSYLLTALAAAAFFICAAPAQSSASEGVDSGEPKPESVGACSAAQLHACLLQRDGKGCILENGRPQCIFE
jgi:hypothetical protein